MRLLAGAVVLGAAVAAAGVAAAEDVPVRHCRSRAEPTRGFLTFNRNDVVAGPVAFSSMRVADPRAISRHDGFFSRKLALKVRTGRPVTVSVPEPIAHGCRSVVPAASSWRRKLPEAPLPSTARRS